jgi:putative ABC transport system ATP-binding protein
MNNSQQYLIEVNDLSRVYNQGGSSITALDRLSFKLPTGTSLAILGPSGSGKTTLLELLGGLSSPTSGTIMVNGKNVFKGTDQEISKFRNETIGFVFQLMHLQDYFTAAENIAMPMIANNVNPQDQRKRADELLELVGLSNRANQYPNQLSGGEMQRVAIARALANNPKVLLADEPTAKLDKVNTDIVLNIFKEIQKRGVSVILITHDPEVANNFQNRIELSHGQVKSINITNN